MSWKRLFRRTAPPNPVILAIQKPSVKQPDNSVSPESGVTKDMAELRINNADHQPAEVSVKRPLMPDSESELLQLDRECIVDESGIRKIFTPGVPLSTRDFLYGRLAEVSSVL